jgi:hypothetical protein
VLVSSGAKAKSKKSSKKTTTTTTTTDDAPTREQLSSVFDSKLLSKELVGDGWLLGKTKVSVQCVVVVVVNHEFCNNANG